MKLPDLKLRRKLNLRVIIPASILIGGLLVVFFLLSSGPKLQPKPKKVKLPNVEIMTVKEETITIPVHTRGVVNPATQIQITSEVNGSVIAISEKLSNGSFFRKGDWLLRIDRSHYEMELEKAQAQEAKAKLHLLKTKASIRSGNIEGISVSRRSELAKGIPQLREAEAQYDASKSAVRLSRKQLEKTKIVAPFDGRVQKKLIDIKEFAAAGKPIAQIYSIDKAEVRLPLSSAQLELINAPLRYAGDTDLSNAPIVILESANGDQWQGRIMRTEGDVDPRNRLNYVVAEIISPYARDPNQPNRPPLAAGTFVEASIQGRLFDKIISIPRDAIHNMNDVWLLDAENRVHVKQVDVLYRGKDRAYLSSGMETGDKIVLTPLEVVVENMEVAVVKESAPLAPVTVDTKFASVMRKPTPERKESQSKSKVIKEAVKKTVSKPAPETPSKTPVSAPDLNISPEDMSSMMGSEQESDI